MTLAELQIILWLQRHYNGTGALSKRGSYVLCCFCFFFEEQDINATSFTLYWLNLWIILQSYCCPVSVYIPPALCELVMVGFDREVKLRRAVMWKRNMIEVKLTGMFECAGK